MSNDLLQLLPQGVRDRYEIYNFNHALEILTQAYQPEFHDLIEALTNFTISLNDILQGGGNESPIPKGFAALLRPKGWEEIRITGDLLLKIHRRQARSIDETIIPDFVAGHNIDYVKGKIAADMEWNSKDQTFDRDLYAFRTFYECGVIACGVLITRSESLNPIFEKYGIKRKYGASTTWMGKLLPRIRSGRQGGCPLLVIGITPSVITDWEVG